MQKESLWEDETDMRLYLGIDAGGTKTECAAGNGNGLLGRATAGSCKLTTVGDAQARENLHAVMRRTCEAARINIRDVNHVCIGISGASLPEVVNWVQQAIREVAPAAIVSADGDHIIAHRAAFGTSPGVLVIAGTGSMAFGRNESGETARAGGWGPHISDEGSAYWVGRETVAAALRAGDAGIENGMMAVIAERWNIAREDVVRLANASLPRFAVLAPSVTVAAEAGNLAAREILERAGAALAILAGAVMGRLWPQGGAAPMALCGGVLQGSALVRRAFKDAMHDCYPQSTVSFAHVQPVLGALEIAAASASNSDPQP